MLLLTTSILVAGLAICHGIAAVTMTTAIKNAFLTQHNNARLKVKISKVVWNDTLSAFASRYLTGCIFKHSGGPYGENIYAGSPRNDNNAQLATLSSQAWLNEIKNVDAKWNCISSTTKTCGHYSQMVWKATTSIGCGIVHCGGAYANIVACEYFPRGNYIGQKPY